MPQKDNFMKKFIILFCGFLFFSCGISKEEYNNVISENKRLSATIIQLEDEIKKLKETDQYYYQSGADEFNNSNFNVAIEWMNNLKIKFPQSNLLSSADKLIKDSNTAIAAIYQKEKQDLDSLLRDASKLDIEKAISKLQNYVSKKHPEDLIQLATQRLDKFEKDYELVRAEREIERYEGIRLIDYTTNWIVHGFSGDQLFSPQIQLKLKNISGKPLSGTIRIKVDFIKNANNEVFGDATDYFLSSSDTPLQPDYVKTAYLYSGVGYKRVFAFYELDQLPSLTANIYINNKLYKKIPIAKKY
jgi:hypothetical protein